MIEAAAVLSLLIHHLEDFWIIMALLLLNAGVAFWQEYKAGNAIEALKQRLALKAKVLRNKQWKIVPARELVPGDIINLRLGDIIPADVKLIKGDYLLVDESSLTGESLPLSVNWWQSKKWPVWMCCARIRPGLLLRMKSPWRKLYRWRVLPKPMC